MVRNGVLESWEAGRTVISAWMNTHAHFIAQTYAAAGCGAVVIDMQHGSAGVDELPALCASIEVRGAEPMVRLPAIEPGLIGRALDAGATGIIAPLVESAAEARRLVEACRYPPQGRRSYGPRVPVLRYGGDYSQFANDGIVILAMIETRAGMAALDEILDTPGLSGVFIGPSDLAMSLGQRPSNGPGAPEVLAAVRRIQASAFGRDRKCGIFCPNRDAFVEAMLAEFDFVTIPPDIATVASETRKILDVVHAAAAGEIRPVREGAEAQTLAGSIAQAAGQACARR